MSVIFYIYVIFIYFIELFFLLFMSIFVSQSTYIPLVTFISFITRNKPSIDTPADILFRMMEKETLSFTQHMGQSYEML